MSRGFAFVEFHTLAAARAALDSGDPIVVDGAVVRVSLARDVKSSGSSSHASHIDDVPESAELSGAVGARRLGAAHQGRKRSGFGIPSGFLPDPSTGFYFSAATGYYYDASTKLYYHPATTKWWGRPRPHTVDESLPVLRARLTIV